MRWLGILLRVVGWLLTPLVVWAASLWGAWAALRVTVQFQDPRAALYTTFGVAVVTGTIVLYLWMQLLRRSPRLRKSLRVTREGLPVIEEDASPESRPTDGEPGESSEAPPSPGSNG